MTNKLELKSSHEAVYTVNVEDVESIFYCKPTDPDILTVLMKDGKRIYCDEVCTVDDPVSEDLEEAANNHAAERYRTTRDRELAEKCKWSFKAGAEWQEEKDDEEKVLIYKHGFDDCEEYIKEHIKEVLLSEVLPCFMRGGEVYEVVDKLDEVLNQKK